MKMIKRVGIIALIMFVLFASGSIYQRVGLKEDLKTVQPVGKFVEVDHKKMHYFEGGNGNASVVLAAGWGTVNPYVDFYPLYDGVARHAKFVVYDKFGYGFSESTDKKRDIDSIVEEIHMLLQKSGQKPPYVFVGHSLGSLETIRYAQTYPEEVKGIVIIDGESPEKYAKQNPVTFISKVQRLLVNTGVARMLYQSESFADSLNNERNALKLLPAELRELDRASTLIHASNKNIIEEMEQSSKNAKQVIEGPKPVHIPMTVISAGSSTESHKQLLTWSTDAKLVEVTAAEHYVHQYHPEIIVEEIASLVEKE